MWSRLRRHTKFALACMAVVLTACATPRTLATFQTGDGTISLQQSAHGDNYSISIGPHPSLPLDGYASAHIESIWDMSSARLIVVSGASTDCRLRYTLVIAAGDTASLHSIGDCGDTYSFARDGNALDIRQTGVPSPKLWTFKDGALDGPTIQVARPSRPASRPTSSRPGENSSDATSPPAVSAPVGDEVIPSPVGSSVPAGSQPTDVPRF
jgi:hypothetical protein